MSQIVNVTNQLPAVIPLFIYIGTTNFGGLPLSFTFVTAGGTPWDWTGYTGEMAIVDNGNVLVTMTTGNGMIALGGNLGTVVLTLPLSSTATLPVTSSATYDLILTSAGATTILPALSGLVTITARTTPQ